MTIMNAGDLPQGSNPVVSCGAFSMRGVNKC